MKDYSVSSIRNKYIDFFKEKNHLHLHSFPLTPKNDDSLLRNILQVVRHHRVQE